MPFHSKQTQFGTILSNFCKGIKWVKGLPESLRYMTCLPNNETTTTFIQIMVKVGRLPKLYSTVIRIFHLN
uniref:Uncharacterized protein n=1 Tax=Wuchereria bancrofti TaxID=6293 RepID=A0A1I8E8M5_WUCBA